MKFTTLIIATFLSLVAAQDDPDTVQPDKSCHPRPTVTLAPPKGCPNKQTCNVACTEFQRQIVVPCHCPINTGTQYACPTPCPNCGPGFVLARDC